MAGLSLTLLFISFLVAFSVKKLITAYRTNVRVHKIPTVGPSSLLLPSFFCAYKLFYHSREFLFEGYKKVGGLCFTEDAFHMHSTMDPRLDLQP